MRVKKEQVYMVNNMRHWAHCLLKRIETNENPQRTDSYHYHDYIELLYFVSGDGCVLINNMCYDVRPGTMMIINANQAHATSFTSSAEFYCIKFLPGVLYDKEQPLWALKYVLPFISTEQDSFFFPKSETENTRIESLLREIMLEWDGGDYAGELVIRANILKIISIIFRIWQQKGIKTDEKEIPDIIKKAVTYTVDNYPTVTMQEVADKCGLSYNYFSHAFHEALGVPFCKYLTTVRINAAQKMLISTDKNITDIAVDTGFSSTSHFIHCFKKEKGVTPLKFRKELTENNAK